MNAARGRLPDEPAATRLGQLLLGIGTADIDLLLGRALRRRFQRSAPVYHGDDPCDGLHLLVTGRIAIRVGPRGGDSALFAVLHAPDSFGEAAVVDRNAPRDHSAVALERSETLLVPTEALTLLRRASPGLDEYLLRLVAERGRRTTEHLQEALHVPAYQRVVRRLIALTDGYALPGQVEVVIPLSQSQLAGLAGTTRQTANKVLAELQEAKVLRLRRATIQVINRPRLRQHATAPARRMLAAAPG